MTVEFGFALYNQQWFTAFLVFAIMLATMFPLISGKRFHFFLPPEFQLYQERSLTKQTRHFASEGPTLQILVGPALAPCRVTNVKKRKVQFMTESSILAVSFVSASLFLGALIISLSGWGICGAASDLSLKALI